MNISDSYAIIYEKHTGRPATTDDLYNADFVEAICKQHKEMKAQVREPLSNRGIVDAKTTEVNCAAMLADIKQIITGEKKTTVIL